MEYACTVAHWAVAEASEASSLIPRELVCADHLLQNGWLLAGALAKKESCMEDPFLIARADRQHVKAAVEKAAP